MSNHTKTLVYSISLLFLFTLSDEALAVSMQTTTVYSQTLGSPITTANTEPMDKGSWSISERFEYTKNKAFSDNELLAMPWAESQNNYKVDYLVLNYGLTETLFTGLMVPYTSTGGLKSVSTRSLLTATPSLTAPRTISGMGDINLYSLWRIAKSTNGFSTSLFTGINMPTGKTSIADSDGVAFSSSDQPGGGDWGGMIGVIFSQDWPRFSLSENFTYTMNTMGKQNTLLGDLFDYNFAFVYALYERKNQQLDSIVELNGEYSAKDIIYSVADPDSGGSSIFALYGLRGSIDEVSLYIGITQPLLEKYYGTQVTSRWGLVTGLDYTIE